MFYKTSIADFRSSTSFYWIMFIFDVEENVVKTTRIVIIFWYQHGTFSLLYFARVSSQQDALYLILRFAYVVIWNLIYTYPSINYLLKKWRKIVLSSFYIIMMISGYISYYITMNMKLRMLRIIRFASHLDFILLQIDADELLTKDRDRICNKTLSLILSTSHSWIEP